MKLLQRFSALRVLPPLVILLVLSGCAAPGGPGGSSSSTTGEITGRALFLGQASSGGILISAESVDGSGQTLAVKRTITCRTVAASGSLAGQTTTDASGAYTLSELTAGNYTVYASSQSCLEKGVTTGVTVVAGRTATAGDLNLTPTGSISGTAALNGAPAVGIIVYVAGTSYSAMSDTSGKFTISSVPAATGYTLVASMQGYNSVTAAVDVAAGATTTLPAAMALTPYLTVPGTGMVTGTAQLTGGASSGGNTGIFVYLAGTQYITMTTSVSGAFTITGVAPGTYTLVASMIGYGSATVASVSVTAGNTASLGTLRLASQVRDAGIVFTLAGTAGVGGSSDGAGSTALFVRPYGIATDGTCLYVTDSASGTIRKVVISTGAVTTLAGSAGVRDSTDGIGPAARFVNPSGIATDGTCLYVTDSASSTIRKVVISTGAVTTLAGSAGVRDSTDGIGPAARFVNPSGIATDGTCLYVADSAASTIRKVVISTGAVTTLAGSAGVRGSSDGTGSAAQFAAPSGVATDGTYLYVADSASCTIRKVVISTAAVTTLAGSASVSGSGDGTGSAAQFTAPTGIATDGTYLYVADSTACTIRKVVISTGAVITLAGLAGTMGNADGIGPTARFSLPVGIATDGTYLYVADSTACTIREIR